MERRRRTIPGNDGLLPAHERAHSADQADDGDKHRKRQKLPGHQEHVDAFQVAVGDQMLNVLEDEICQGNRGQEASKD